MIVKLQSMYNFRINFNKIIQFLSLVSLLFFTACSLFVPKKLEEHFNFSQWCQHQKKIRNLIQTKVFGTFIYISDMKKAHAYFLFERKENNCYCLLLINPFGNIKFKLNSCLDNLKLIKEKDQIYNSADNKKMIINLIDIPLPILLNNLHQWILGLPGDATNYRINDQFHLSEINYVYNGKTWKVIYDKYNQNIQLPFPSSIEFIHGNERIKLKINNWIIK